jgi:uncharacterized membrane protein
MLLPATRAATGRRSDSERDSIRQNGISSLNPASRRNPLRFRVRTADNASIDRLSLESSMAFTPIIVAHIAAAIGALVIGGLSFSLRKGTPLHRRLGRLWVVLMLATALLSFGIQTRGHFSWIHLLSVITLIGVPAALAAAARGNIQVHRRGMRAAYFGLLIAGMFTLLPGRRLGYLVWHAVGFV